MGRQLRRLSSQVTEDCYIIETQIDGKTEVSVFKTRTIAVREWNKWNTMVIEADKYATLLNDDIKKAEKKNWRT